MKIYIDEACRTALTFDKEGYLAFLREQGIVDTDRDRLTVSLLLPHPRIRHIEQRWGVYSRSTCTIEVYLWMSALISGTVNHTLLHETRHFMQDCQGHGDHIEERSLPYYERPYEIDARSFADQHSPHCAFFVVADMCTGAMHEKLKEALRTWWTRDELSIHHVTRGVVL
jgi:hypothetical protein